MNTYRVTFFDVYDDYLLTRDIKAKYADEAKKIAVAELEYNANYWEDTSAHIILANYKNIDVRRLKED